ncbi:hypothetical protein B0H17DRAFT_392237 [Mycena rosella]|uniref:Uncharacterized protein n=1 Tax=Mycena rosella TaxID=1033263 RepID=A0AAD7DQN7_MYCRO|nr:hypothetical protein B0H17DRAFT_392237 [Mycena rosella]
MPGNRCTNCVKAQTQCTHARLKPVENIRPPPSPSLIIKTAQDYIEEILGTSTVYIPPADPHQVLVQIAQYARTLEERLAALQEPILGLTSKSPKAPSPGALGAPTKRPPIVKGLLTGVLPNMKTNLFYGESSSVQFLHSAMKRIHGSTLIGLGVQPPEFCPTQPWEKLIIDAPQQVFPDDDLLTNLVNMYFERINPIISILHSPTFRQSIAEGLHLRDQRFGAVVLTVCSLASRYSDDPRVFLDGVNSKLSCGWKWFHQVLPLIVLAKFGSVQVRAPFAEP